MTPAHLLATNPGKGDNVVNALSAFLNMKITTNSQRFGATLLNTHDESPTAVAIRGNNNLVVALYLYKRHPVEVSQFTKENHKTKVKRIEEDYVNNITADITPEQYELLPSEQHGWVQFVNGILREDLIAKLVTFLKDTKRCSRARVEMLAYAKDHNSRQAIDVSIKSLKEAFSGRLSFLGRYELEKGPPIHMSATCVVIKAQDAKMEDFYEGEFNEYTENGDSVMSKSKFKVALQALDLISDKKDEMNGKVVDQFFAKADIDNSDEISKKEFVKFCLDEFGRNVALKFMRKKDQVQRELDLRRSLNTEYVMRIFPSDKLSEDSDVATFIKPYLTFNDEAGQSPKGHTPEDYSHLLVMPFGDRNLDTIFRSERPDPLAVRNIMKKVGRSLAHLHEKGIVHGDLKMLNVVRTHGRFVLIDLDASARESQDHVGAKFSSGVLPPEMIDKLADYQGKQDVEQYNKKEDKDEQSKRAPKYSALPEKKGYVVRSFLTKEISETGQDDETGKPTETTRIVPRGEKSLPYELVKALPSFDVWSFGVLLYLLCTQEHLFPVNRDDDIKDGGNTGDSFKRLHEWDERELNATLQSIQDKYARKLIMRILKKNPSDRPTMNEILNDDFFHPSKQVDVVGEIQKNRILITQNGKAMKDGFSMIRQSLNRMMKNQMAMANMLKDIVLDGDHIPKYFGLCPVEVSGLEWANPNNWIKKKFKLIFFCPVTRKSVLNTEGEVFEYEIELTQDWVKKYGPAIIIGLKILEVCVAAGVIPIPPLRRHVQEFESNLLEKSTIAEKMQDIVVDHIMGGEEGDNMTQTLFTKISEKADDSRSDFVDAVYSTSPLTDNEMDAIKDSFKGIGTLINDKKFERCGLVKACASDGTVEFVHPDIEPYFLKHGKACYEKSPEEIDKEQSKTREEKLLKLEQSKGNIVHEGWLLKKSQHFPFSWKERYFLLYEYGAVEYFRYGCKENNKKDVKRYRKTKWNEVGKVGFELKSVDGSVLKVRLSNHSGTMDVWKKGNQWQ